MFSGSNSRGRLTGACRQLAAFSLAGPRTHVVGFPSLRARNSSRAFTALYGSDGVGAEERPAPMKNGPVNHQPDHPASMVGGPDAVRGRLRGGDLERTRLMVCR